MRCTRTATRRTPGPARARAASPDSRTTTRPHRPGTARPRTVARRAPAARPSRCRPARVTRPSGARGAIGVEADQPGKPAGAAVHLVDDLFVVDAFQQLARQSHARRLAALPQLVEKAVRDQLQTFFDQLVVNLALLLDLVWGLEPGGKAGLELAKADVVEAGGVDVISGDAACGFATQLDGPVHRPVRRTGVVDRDEDLAVHRHLPLGRGEYVSDWTGCQVSGGTSCLPSESQTVMASTGHASHAWSNRSRSTRSGSRNVAIVSASNLKASGAAVAQSPNPTHWSRSITMRRPCTVRSSRLTCPRARARCARCPSRPA